MDGARKRKTFMAIINRDKARAEKRDIFDYNFTNPATSSTFLLAQVPYLGLAVGGYFAAIGLSGSPVYSLAISRFIAGATNAGVTTIGLGVTISPTVFGTSGGVNFTFGTSGGISTILGQGVTALVGDQIILNSAGSNASSAQASISIVIECLQDIKSQYGF